MSTSEIGVWEAQKEGARYGANLHVRTTKEVGGWGTRGSAKPEKYGTLWKY